MDISFSVIISLYNKEEYIGRAIESVLAQTYQEFEIVVVDDCSTDEGPMIVESCPDDRIRLIRHSNNQGVSKTRNTGIANARYEMVSFLDADDHWKPDYLDTILSLIEKFPGCGIYATSYEYQTQKGEVSYPKIPKISPDWFGILEDYFSTASTGHPFQTSSVTVKKKAIRKIGGFPEDLKAGEGQDIYTWALLALNYQIAFMNHPKTVYSLGVANQASISKARHYKIVTRLLKFLEMGLIPEDQISSFNLYLSRVGTVNARNSILLGNDGTQARFILKLIPPKKIHFFLKWWWYYFWSFSPLLFRLFVRLKEKVKNSRPARHHINHFLSR